MVGFNFLVPSCSACGCPSLVQGLHYSNDPPVSGWRRGSDRVQLRGWTRHQPDRWPLRRCRQGAPYDHELLDALDARSLSGKGDGLAGALTTWNPLSPLIITTRQFLTGEPQEHLLPFAIVFGGSLMIGLCGLIAFRVTMPHVIARMGG